MITCVGDDAELDLEFYRDGERIDGVIVDAGSPIGVTDNAEMIGEVKYHGGGAFEEKYVYPAEKPPTIE